MNKDRLKENKNTLTLKISYTTKTEEEHKRILKYIKNYNSVFNCIFNFLQKKNPKATTKEVFEFLKTKNNFWIGYHFQNGAFWDARALFSIVGDKKVIFGGKRLFIDRQKRLISKEEFKIKKLRPLQVLGSKENKGNIKFQILNEKEILFKPTRNEHFILQLQNVGKNYQKYLKALILCQENRETPITYKVDSDYIYLLFDLSAALLKTKTLKSFQKVKDRIFAIDMNPNFIGWSVVDWKSSEKHKTIKAGLVSFKLLNDKENNLKGKSSESFERKKLTNKRRYEMIETAYFLIRAAKSCKCEFFIVENLQIKRRDSGKGARFNRLIHTQWNRTLLLRLLEKLCKVYEINLLKVSPDYSSFQGNLVYREEKLPDPCLSSIEIGRRGYEFHHQYVLKDTPQTKNIIFDNTDHVKTRISQSLEELGFSETWENLQELYFKLKKARCSYRFPVEQACEAWSRRFSSKNHRKALTISYSFG